MKLKLSLFLALLVAALPVMAGNAMAQATADERAGFQSRQETLVALAETLGALHELRKLCRSYDRPDLFRDRMKELIALEEPTPPIQSAMVEGFNRSRREIAARYDWCSSDAEQEMRDLAEIGQQQARNLGEPLRAVEGYDYYPGVETVEGVTVYRGRPREDD